MILSILFAQQLTLANIQNFSETSSAQLPAVAEEAGKYFAELGIRFRMQYLTLDSTAHPDCENQAIGSALFGDYPRTLQLNCLSQELQRRGFKYSRKKLFFFFVAKWTDEKRERFVGGGIAAGICHTVAEGAAENPENIRQSGQLVAHEVAHLMCATHIKTHINLMYPVLLTQSEGLVAVDDFTKIQVRRWYARVRKANTLPNQ